MILPAKKHNPPHVNHRAAGERPPPPPAEIVGTQDLQDHMQHLPSSHFQQFRHHKVHQILLPQFLIMMKEDQLDHVAMPLRKAILAQTLLLREILTWNDGNSWPYKTSNNYYKLGNKFLDNKMLYRGSMK